MNNQIKKLDPLFESKNSFSIFYIVINIVLFILCLAVIGLYAFVSLTFTTTIEGESMENTIQNKSSVLVYSTNKFTYNDIVIIQTSSKPLIKRVIGLEGDTILYMRDSVNPIYCNLYRKKSNLGYFELVDEPYIRERMYSDNLYHSLVNNYDPTLLSTNFNESFDKLSKYVYTFVEDDSFYFLGDNRNNSIDSRGVYGCQNVSTVIGKYFLSINKNNVWHKFLYNLY